MNNLEASSRVQAKTFKTLYCEVFRCRSEQFVQKLLWRSLHLRALPVALILKLIRPRFFRLDIQLIEEIGEAQGAMDVMAAINGFRQDCRSNNSFQHEDMRVRISGKRLLSVFKKTRLKAQAAAKI
jgi:hypothetical protein